MAFSIRFTDAFDTAAELRAATATAGQDALASVNAAIADAHLDFARQVESLRQAVSTSFDDFQRSQQSPNAATVFDDATLSAALSRSGVPGLDGSVDIRNLNDLATIASRFPADLAQPDSTGEVPTGSSAIGREEAAVAASLSAAPRIVEALGPTAQVVDVHGQSFVVTERYEDSVTGFSAVHLTSTSGGQDVFAVDGLEVGSRADEVAAVTLGRLQVTSAEFREMVADAAATAAAGHRLVFTGPSLGGAVAQVGAYETAEALVLAQQSAGGTLLTPDTLHLVTVDPLGGRDAAEDINGGILSPAALQAITALNIRTDGDIVSRIGSHIGATLTLPALDAQGHLVQLTPAEAHVDVVSLLQNLSSDALFAQGVKGAPAEISGFARASDAVSDQLVAAWLASGQHDDTTPGALQIPGTASFDPTGTVWSLDADNNGTVDIAVHLSAPIDQARADLVLG